MGARRKARAAAVLAADLEARLAALGVHAESVTGAEIAGLVGPAAGLVADAERDLDKARATAAALLNRAAGRIAARERRLDDFNPAEWAAFRVPAGSVPASRLGLS